MCFNRSLNNKTDRLHERCLRITYSLSLNKLLGKDCCVSIHHQNIRQLAIEIFKVFSGWSPEIIKIFQFKDEVPYNLRQRSQVFNDTGSIKFLGLKMCELVPDEIKLLEILGNLAKK